MGYDLDQFFRVKTQIGLPGGVTVYMRTLSDWEARQRVEAGVLASAEKRRELRNPETVAYAAYVEPIRWATEEDLRKTILLLEQRNISRDVLDEVTAPYIPFPEDASLQERQDVAEERKKVEEETRERRKKAIDAKTKALEKDLGKKKKDYLVKRCEMAQVESQALVAYVDEFNRRTIFYSCFRDEARKERLFEGSEDIKALPSLIYDKLLAQYQTIDQAQTRDLVDFFQGRQPPADG